MIERFGGQRALRLAAVEALYTARGGAEDKWGAIVAEVEEVGVGRPHQIRQQKGYEHVNAVVVSATKERGDAEQSSGDGEEAQEAAFAVRGPYAGRQHELDGVAGKNEVSAAPKGEARHGHFDGSDKAAGTAKHAQKVTVIHKEKITRRTGNLRSEGRGW